MNKTLQELADQLLHTDFEKLPEREQRVIRRMAERLHISRNINREFEEQMTLGQRVADRVAAFGGSWTFILLFAAFLVTWLILNTLILPAREEAFDPFPYILLNLLLSMVAAIQAPIILMSQNRQAAKDRLDAAHDYEVNLKAELEIMDLHKKLDVLREDRWKELVAIQQEQISLLRQILVERKSQDQGGGAE